MQNLSDNELDKRFRDAADGYRPSFEPEAWQAMQQQLDREPGDERRGFGGKINRYLPLVFIFLTGSVTGILTWNYFDERAGNNQTNPIEQSHIAQKETEGDLRKQASSASEPVTDKNPATTSAQRDDNTGQSGPRSHAAEIVAPDADHVAINTLRVLPKSKAESATIEGTSPIAGQNDPVGTGSLTRKSNDDDRKGTLANSSNDRHDAVNDDSDAAMSNGNVTAMTSDLNQEDSQEIAASQMPEDPDGPVRESANPVVAEASIDSTQIIDEKEQEESAKAAEPATTEDQAEARVPAYRLSVAAAISPDFSSVNFGTHTRPGVNAGLLIAYHISQRISVQSGAILSQKIYSARNLEYHGYTAEKADGDCRIIDIPVNVSYRFPSRSSYSLYLTAGFSSYLMKKEDYTFTFDSYDGPYEYSRSIRNENNEWFKVMNFSVGVSRKLSERVFLEAEPFVKLPVSGIGDGKLNVNTIGLFLRLRYSFLQAH